MAVEGELNVRIMHEHPCYKFGNLAHVSPTPGSKMVTILRTICLLASAIGLGGKLCFAKGLSPSRTEMKVVIPAPGTMGDEATNAFSTSAVFVGVLLTIINPSVALWLQEMASITTSLPVRPLASMSRKCIVLDGR